MINNLSKESLISFFLNGCKKKKDWRVGTEHEKFGFKKSNLKPIVYKDIKYLTSVSFLYLLSKYIEHFFHISSCLNISPCSLHCSILTISIFSNEAEAPLAALITNQ